MLPSRKFFLAIAALTLVGMRPARAQVAITIPTAKPTTQPELQHFDFASDGPIGPGWSRPDQVARVYVHEELPALFRRTVRLDSDIPQQCSLSWIFTGPHAGLTVELTPTKVRLLERFYDSTGLDGGGNYPQKTIRDTERTYLGHPRTLTVVVDAHLAVTVLLNGEQVLWQPLVFDLTRHQLMFTGPRHEHRILSGSILQQPAESASITVDPSHTHQTMIGFGGSPSVPAYAELSPSGKQQYWDILRHYNLLIDREYPMGTQLKPDLSNADDLADASPHYYGDNFPNGEVSDFDYSRHTRTLGGEVLYEMWALPKWAVQAYTPQGAPVVDAWGKAITTAAKPDVYARLVVDFCKLAKAKSGAAPEIVGVENEVEQAPEIFAAMTTTLRKALDAAGFSSTKIQMADAPYLWMASHRADDLKHYPQAWHDTDFTAAHQYDVQEFLANPDLYDARLTAMHNASDGKPFLATEICLNDPAYQEPSYRLALQVAQLYQKDLTDAGAEMLLYCWLILDVEQPTFGGSRSLLVPDRDHGFVPVASSFQLRTLGAFSRHVLKGMRRVDAASTNPDLLTVAFTDGTHSTLIVLNRSTAPQQLHTTWPGIHWTTAEHTTFYSANVDSAVPVDLTVQPGEILTLSNFQAAQ